MVEKAVWKMVFLFKTFKFPEIKSLGDIIEILKAHTTNLSIDTHLIPYGGLVAEPAIYIRCPTTFKFLVISALFSRCYGASY